jgi:hypothetical protein
MVQVQQRFLIADLLALFLLLDTELLGRRFYPDDPMWSDPKPMAVQKPRSRKINEYYDFFLNTFFEPGVKDRVGPPVPAGAVNTLGDVPDSGWYTNRHGRKRMTMAELLRGPGQDTKPSMNGPWTVLSAKNEGITPGLVIRDSKGKRFVLKFDPLNNPDMASAADVIGSKFFYALGYNVPENYIVYFERKQLAVGEKTKFTTSGGRERALTPADINDMLRKVPRNREGQYRGLASLFIPGDIIGPFKYWRVRTDDPNDIVAHENRRDLRGLYVFASWLNHTDSKSINSLDSVVEEAGLRYIRHYLIDFGAILGSDSFEPKSPRAGNVYLFDFKPGAGQLLSLGLYVPRWMRVHFPDLPEAGHLQADVFEPDKWKSNYPNPAFDNRLPDDCYWAAKQVMAFTDDEIRALVATGDFSDPRALEWITRALIARRDKIGRHYFSQVLPLENFRAEGGRLAFDDLAERYHFGPPRTYTVQWSRFHNEDNTVSAIPGAASFALPEELRSAPAGSYFTAGVGSADDARTLIVYLRKAHSGIDVVGIDRRW